MSRIDAQMYRFQSTLSVRRATDKLISEIPPDGISIHALREESDITLHIMVGHLADFNPRSP